MLPDASYEPSSPPDIKASPEGLRGTTQSQIISPVQAGAYISHGIVHQANITPSKIWPLIGNEIFLNTIRQIRTSKLSFMIRISAYGRTEKTVVKQQNCRISPNPINRTSFMINDLRTITA